MLSMMLDTIIIMLNELYLLLFIHRKNFGELFILKRAFLHVY